MALRLVSHMLARQAYFQLQTKRNIYCRGKINGYISSLFDSNWLQPCRLRMLHVRISDQDAGLQAKREANKLSEIDDDLQNEYENTYKSPRRKFEKSKVSADEAAVQKDKLVDEVDSDSFGGVRLSELEKVDAGDIEEEEYISRPTRHSKKLRTKEYARMIKEHLNANRLNDAIAVLEQRMLKEDRVKPESYIYSLLISGCAKAGYTRKAFSLYTKMRQRGLTVKGGTYTSLFNACANAPTKADGLAKAQSLRENMLEKGHEPNVKNYNAMIKAYGRCGDIQTAYLLADEMLERQLEINTETINFLLQACASDETHGFRHSLLTWHKMLRNGIRPDYYTFNTMLRCARDCGFGDLESMQAVLEQITPGVTSNSEVGEDKQMFLPIKDSTTDGLLAVSSKATGQIEVSTTATELEIPNLLLPRPHLGSLIALTEITCPHERFLLLGGVTGFLELMKAHGITPDIETFTTMTEVIPPTKAAEKQLLTFVRKIGLKADIDFFNILIKKRSMRFDYDGAREVLKMIRTADLKPDIVTYGVLALGCRTQEEARELLLQMKTAGIRMNMPILGAMLRQGCAQKSFAYINEIMQISLEENIRPNETFLRHLYNYHKSCARAIDARHPATKSAAYKKGHAKFCDKYRLYYDEKGLAGLKLEDAIAKVKERPYARYTETPIEGLEPLKHEQIKRKTKVRKYIKKIKIDQLEDDHENTSNVKRITE